MANSVSYRTSTSSGPTSGQTAAQVQSAVLTATSPIALTQTQQQAQLDALVAKDVTLDASDTATDASLATLSNTDISAGTIDAATGELALTKVLATLPEISIDLSSLKGPLHNTALGVAAGTAGAYNITSDGLGAFSLTPSAAASTQTGQHLGSSDIYANLPAAPSNASPTIRYMATLTRLNAGNEPGAYVDVGAGWVFEHALAGPAPVEPQTEHVVDEAARLAFDILTLSTNDTIIQDDTGVHYVYDGTGLVAPSTTAIPDVALIGSGPPASNAAGAGFYYLEYDAATGTSNIWGPTIADGSYPAQADAAFASSPSYTHPFTTGDFETSVGPIGSSGFQVLETVHKQGTDFKHVTVFDANNEVVTADVVQVDPVSGAVTLTAPDGFEFQGTLYIS
jgi:hypothetical protein